MASRQPRTTTTTTLSRSSSPACGWSEASASSEAVRRSSLPAASLLGSISRCTSSTSTSGARWRRRRQPIWSTREPAGVEPIPDGGRIRPKSRKAASLQVHAAEEVLKAWVGARRVEKRGHLHTRQSGIALFARLLEVREAPVLVVQRHPQGADGHVPAVFPPGTVLQTASQLEALRPATGQGVDPGAPPLQPDIRCLGYLVHLRERLGVVALKCVHPREIAVNPVEPGVHL